MYLILLSLLSATWILLRIYEHPIKMTERVAVYIMKHTPQSRKYATAQVLSDLFGCLNISYGKRLVLLQTAMPSADRSWFSSGDLAPLGLFDEHQLFTRMARRILDRSIPENVPDRLSRLHEIGVDLGLSEETIQGTLDAAVEEYQTQ